eukprot:TRINITY_DN220_c0_g1_i2.p1 TRINITY_DN220_c0_g1~~TRINITY_DN220_c0_g1_i2.p1  ORF type:complete len:782 (+),score=58.82 TRINITY_DN220_c0_g1_i2:69-2414(+)
MGKRICIGKQPHKEWFDNECRLKRRKVRRLLRKYKHSVDKDDRVLYCIERREYKNMLARKKTKHRELLLTELLNSVKCQKTFWEIIRKVSRKKTQPQNSISIDQWFEHFKRVLEKEADDSIEEDTEEDVDEEEEFLDRPISREEVMLAIKKLKNGKAAGPDRLIGEFFKHSCDSTLTFLVKLFNYLFDNGIYPENWTESIILPLFKKGDANDTNNYRGVSLCNISSKLYSSIINNRLQEWVNMNNITGEHQAGFKKGYCTIDHMFTLLAAVQKQFASNTKLYVAFVDFEKAFDSISRKLLWPVLKTNRVRGKLYRCIRSMYREVKARIRKGAKLSDYVNCTSGVKQGDVCSPILFSLFVNELALEIISNGRHGVSLDLLELFILLFADDIILLSISVVGLQRQLNSLYTAASRLELKVNMDKTNIVVFRKGGYLARSEKWTYGGEIMKVVNMYKYLGIFFSTRLSFSFACQDLVKRAKRAVLMIFQAMHKLDCTSFNIFSKLFDSQVQSILQYGAEIWAFQNGKEIEKLHLFAMKRFLNVNSRTPNDFVYGDLGRYPLYLNSYVKCISYWLKLTRMDNHRLPYKAYKTIYNLDVNGKKTWVTDVRKCLYSYGFAYVWENQGVENIIEFIKCFKQRIIDCRWQGWHDHIQNSDRFAEYKMFKSINGVEPYIEIVLNRYVKSALTKLRFSVSDIACHRFRYSERGTDKILCRLCQASEEDEIHFMFCCPVLQDLRIRLIQPKYYNNPCHFRFNLLMASNSEKVISNMALYVYKALTRLRNAAM